MKIVFVVTTSDIDSVGVEVHENLSTIKTPAGIEPKFVDTLHGATYRGITDGYTVHVVGRAFVTK